MPKPTIFASPSPSLSAPLPLVPRPRPPDSFAPSFITDRPISAAVLLGRHPASLAELRRLVDGLGISVVASELSRRGTRDAWLGRGKQAALAALLARLASDAHLPELTLIVDDTLAPGQLRRLEQAVGAPVADRTDVILRVFARRAQTRMARLEVELARLRYDAPRVRDTAGINDRGGGGGRGERGHTGVELRKQRMRARQVALARDLEALRAHNEAERDRRGEAPAVALVGYTNAGKSSLMRALTGSAVLTADQLFATLGTTVRALAGAPPPRVLVTDTVGFIRDLPTELVASFRSTLEEARAADLLLFVVDATDPEREAQLRLTRETIAGIGAGKLPALVVLNKIDLVSAEQRAALAAAWPEALALSAHRDEDIERLRAAIVAFFDDRMLDDVFSVPPTDARRVAEVHAEARVVATDYAEDGTVTLRVRALPATLARLRKSLAAPPPPTTPAELVALARQHGLAVSSPATAFETTGLDFLVVHAHDEAGVPFILRTPRRPDVVGSARREARALRLVAPRLPVAVPAWCVHARDLIAYRRLPGTPVVTVDAAGTVSWNGVDPQAPPARFLDDVATALAALQAVSPDLVRNAGLPTPAIGEVREELARTMAEVREALAPSEATWAAWQKWLADDALWPAHVALVHGDLHPGHLLLDAEGHLTGILDWTEASLGDPALDLAMFHGCFGAAALAELLPRFERAGGRVWPGMAAHVAHRWSAFPVTAAAWALRTENPEVLARARAMLPPG